MAAKPATATKRGSPKLVLATCILASSLAFIDGSVVNVGLPAIGTSLAAQGDELQWIINAYLLPLSALLLLGGAAGDRFGRRLLLIFGIAVFLLASILCALAPNILGLISARAIQGAGAAILLPNSLAILGQTFSGETRGRAIGTWAATGAIVGAVGPVLGGWLIDTVGWRAIFLINVPPGAVAIWLAIRFVADQGGAKKAPLDLSGALLATVALGALTWGLTIGAGAAGWRIQSLLSLSAGVALILCFIWLEDRRGNHAMMPLALFESQSFIALTLLTFLLYGALGGLLVLLPYTLIRAAHYSGTAAGAALLPVPLVMALASRVAGGFASRIGPRWPLTIGPLLVAGGFVLLLRVDASGEYWTIILPALLVVALGMTATAAPLTTAVLSSVDAAHTGSASGFNSAVARTGGLVATALLGTVLAANAGQLLVDFRAAAIAGAIICVAASASIFGLLRETHL